jgi:chromosome segregation ATPase
MGELMRVEKEIDVFTERLRGIVREKAIAAHEELKATIRAQHNKLNQLSKRIAEAKMELNDRKGDVAEVMTALNAARLQDQELGIYAARAEKAKAAAKIQKAETAVDIANGRVSEVMQRINVMSLTEHVQLTEELERLKEQEKELRADIEGAPYSDRWGIQHGPRPPL